MFTLSADILRTIGRPYLLSTIIDKAENTRLTYISGLWYIFLYMFFSSLYIIRDILRQKIDFPFKFGLREELRNYLFCNLLSQSNDFFDINFSGYINSRIKDIVDVFIPFLDKIFSMISSVVVFITTLYIFSSHDILLGLMTFVWFVLYFLLYNKVCNKFKKQSKAATIAESKCLGKMSDCLNNIMNIKAFSREEDEKLIFKKETEKVLENNWILMKTERKIHIINLLNIVSFSCVVFLRLYVLYQAGKITIGNLVFNMNCVNILFWWVEFVARAYISSMADLIKMDETIKMLTCNTRILDNLNSKNYNFEDGDIVFKNV
ncbi:MAG: ABC transporter ATP-binding protein/permease, partial [Rickettsiales bacterium]|nr:ABC transporter ATP-binding protein/permease [Rickettsiales bacterium]